MLLRAWYSAGATVTTVRLPFLRRTRSSPETMITTGIADSSRARAPAYILREAVLRASSSSGSFFASAGGSAAGAFGFSAGDSP